MCRGLPGAVSPARPWGSQREVPAPEVGEGERAACARQSADRGEAQSPALRREDPCFAASLAGTWGGQAQDKYGVSAGGPPRSLSLP